MIHNNQLSLVIMLMVYLVMTPIAANGYLPPTDMQSNQLKTESSATVVSEKDKRLALNHYRQGKKRLTKKSYDQAIEEFTRALALYPNWANAKRGLSWARKDKQRQMLEDGAGSSSLHDLVLQAQDQYRLGKKLETEDRPIEAAAKYKAALRIIPGYPEALAALDRLQVRTQKSLVQGHEVTRVTSRTAAPSYKLTNPRAANRQQVTKKIKKSSSITNKTRLQARNSSIKEAIQKHYLAGIQAFNSSNYTIAINEFELIIEFVPNHNKALFYLNKAKKKLYKQVREMKAKVKRAQSTGDRLSEITALHAIVSMAPNDQEARKAWALAKKEKEVVIGELYRRGVEAYAKGEYRQALKSWDVVLDLNPKHKKAAESIKKVREKLELIKN